MDYQRQIEEISKYIRSGEKKKGELKLGLEFEHFVIDRETLKTISYYGKNGVGETLKKLEENGWEGIYEGEFILALEKQNKSITIEPGSQLELSLKEETKIKDIEKEYLEFLNEIIPILESKGQGLITVGYHPETKIEDIKIIPKKRYDYMFNYFKSKGTLAHNMMKGSAALQVSIDYIDEEDYKKKFRVINALSPVVYSIFESARYFEGEIWNKHNLRAFIWENCDSDRCGIVEGALDDDFSYNKYAEYILNRPPILIMKDGESLFTGDKKVKDIFDPDNYNKEELEHLLTMFFPDARTKRYIEIRMMDAVPYPLNLASAAMWKGLLYNDKNLEEVHRFIKDIEIQDIINTKREMMDVGLDAKLKGKSFLEIGKWIVELAKEGLENEEIVYISCLEEMLSENKTPYIIIKENEIYGKEQSLEWCMLNNVIKR